MSGRIKYWTRKRGKAHSSLVSRARGQRREGRRVGQRKLPVRRGIVVKHYCPFFIFGEGASLDSNQEHYSIGIASNYYSSKSSSLIVISKNITCLMGLGGVRWQNVRVLGESLRRLKR